MSIQLWSGDPYPLGATWDGQGVNFALFADQATAVELCLFNSAVGEKEIVKISLYEKSIGLQTISDMEREIQGLYP